MSNPSLPDHRTADTSIAVWAALFAALVASLGSLWLTLGMELKACPLCLYQRASVFAVAAVLAIGVLMRERGEAGVCLAALPAAVAGLGVGIFHNYLEYSGKLVCPKGIAGIGTAPQQALVAQAIVTLLLLVGGRRRIVVGLTALVIGGVMAGLLIQSAPPLPEPKPIKKLDMCVPPYKAPEGQ